MRCRISKISSWCPWVCSVCMPVCCVISSKSFQGQLVSIRRPAVHRGMGGTHSPFIHRPLHKLSELRVSALDSLWNVVYLEIRSLTHSSLFLLLCTLFLAFLSSVNSFMPLLAILALLDLLYLSSLILLKFRTFYPFTCSFTTGVCSKYWRILFCFQGSRIF